MKYSLNLKLALSFCLLFPAITGCGGFGLSDKIKTPSITEEKPNFRENTAETDLSEVIENSYQKLYSGESYRARREEIFSADGGDPMTSTVTVEFVKPNSFHTVYKGKGGWFPFQGEWIFIGQDSYLKYRNWKKTAAQAMELMNGRELPPDFSGVPGMIEESLSTKHKSSNDIKLIGQETVNGLPAKVYQFTRPLDTGSQKSNSKSKVWIGLNDNLPYKSETDYEFSWGPHVTRSKITITFYDFGTELKIEPPIK